MPDSAALSDYMPVMRCSCTTCIQSQLVLVSVVLSMQVTGAMDTCLGSHLGTIRASSAQPDQQVQQMRCSGWCVRVAQQVRQAWQHLHPPSCIRRTS